MHSYIHKCIHTHIPTDIHAYIHAYILTYIQLGCMHISFLTVMNLQNSLIQNKTQNFGISFFHHIYDIMAKNIYKYTVQKT